MAQKKKIIIKQNNSISKFGTNSKNTNNQSIHINSSDVDEIQQNNNLKIYSFNPFQPKTHVIQTKTGVIRINIK